MSFVAHGYLAVDFFFQLSGYVIALNYADRFRAFRFGEAAEFIMMRLARIYPLHLFMLFVFLVNPIAISAFSTQGEIGGRYDPAYWLLSVFLVQNWGFTDRLGWNVPAWSISTEWFAYLLFPLLAGFAMRLRCAFYSGVAVALLLGTLMSITSAFGPSLGSDIEHFGLLRCLIQFSIGICLFRLRWHIPGPHRLTGNFAALVAFICFFVSVAFSLPDYVLMPLGFAVFIFSITDAESFFGRLLGNPKLEMIGLMSYATYMSHFFIKDWVKFTLVGRTVPDEIAFFVYLLLTVFSSALLYRWIEVPGRRFMRSLAHNALRKAKLASFSA